MKALLYLVSYLIFAGDNLLTGADHGPLKLETDRKGRLRPQVSHDPVAQNWKTVNFREDGIISLRKIQIYQDFLDEDYKRKKNRVYETAYKEALIVRRVSEIEAKAYAEKEVRKNGVLKAYKKYLFPKLTEIRNSVSSGQENSQTEGLLDDYVRGMTAIYIPNPYNTMYEGNINLGSIIKRTVWTPRVSKFSSAPQANNLIVDEERIQELSKELGPLSIGQILDHNQVKKLMDQGYDISKINPGVSALWAKRQEGQDLAMVIDDSLFPDEDSKLKFKSVKLGGAGSQKLSVKYKKGGKKNKIKLKVGDEVHNEIFTSTMMKALGHSQDPMIFRKKSKFYLGKKTYDDFVSELSYKYGNESSVRYNIAHGKDDDTLDEEGNIKKGKEWVLWQDTLFEGRPKKEVRMAPLDIGAWDLRDRREYRGMQLIFAWLAISDMKSDNMKVLIKKVDGTWIPDHRIQDVGFSLGTTLKFKRPTDLLNLISLKKAVVNDFKTEVVETHQNGNAVSLDWNDFKIRSRNYNRATYYDLKWQARKIAKLDEKFIVDALKLSGMNPDAAELYRIKLIKRRNNIVKAFKLDEEDDIEILPVVENLYKYNNPDFPNIRNGRITKSAFLGHNEDSLNHLTWGSFLGTFAGSSVPFAAFSKKIKSKFTAGVSANISGLSADGTATPYEVSGDYGIGAGVSLRLLRKVVVNPQPAHIYEGKEQKLVKRPYEVVDTASIRVGVGSNLLSRLTKKIPFPVTGDLEVKAFEKSLEYRHGANSVKEGYLKPFDLINIIRDQKGFATEGLKDLEQIETSTIYGLDAVLAGRVKTGEMNKNGMSTRMANKVYKVNRYFRDQNGELHRIKENAKRTLAAADLDILNIDAKLFTLPVLELAGSTGSFNSKISDIIVRPQGSSKKDFSHTHQEHTAQQSNAELALLKDSSPSQDKLVTNLEIETRGGQKSRKGVAFFGLSNSSRSEWADTTVTLADKTQKHFYRTQRSRNHHVGKEDVAFDLGNTDLMKLEGKIKIVEAEAEMSDPKKFVIHINSQVFDRHEDKEGLETIIKKLNARYSQDSDNLFFRNIWLPAKEDMDSYRKIYGVIRIYVDGEYLLKKVEGITEDKLVPMLDSFASQLDTLRCTDNFRPIAKKSNQIFYFKRKKSILKVFRKLKRELQKGDLNYPSIYNLANKFASKLFSRYLGVQLLKTFLNDGIETTGEVTNKGLLVLGDIRGMEDSISTLDRLSGQSANAAPAGIHWGEFKFDKDKIRPIQHFLRYKNPQLPTSVKKVVTDKEMYGRAETGQAPNVQ